MAAATGADRVYLLKARGAPGFMSIRGTKYTPPYIVAFEKIEHAVHVQKFAHDFTEVEICRYLPKKIESGIIGDIAGRIRINKKININKLGCDVVPCETLEFMSYPSKKNLGAILAYQLVHETDENAFFQAEILYADK